MFEMFTPAKLGQHRLFFTCAWTMIIFSVFWYMIGEFPYYESVQFPNAQRSACLQAIFKTPMGYGSSQLVHWINQVWLQSNICLSSITICMFRPYVDESFPLEGALLLDAMRRALHVAISKIPKCNDST